MLGVVWFFAIYWRRSGLRDLGFRYYSIVKTIWYTFLSLILIFIVSFLYVFILQKVFGIDAPPSKIDELVSKRQCFRKYPYSSDCRYRPTL